MNEFLRRSAPGIQVSGLAVGDNTTTAPSTLAPYGLTLQQTINAGTTSVTIPAGVIWVYAICVGAGGARGGAVLSGGGAGGISWGWT